MHAARLSRSPRLKRVHDLLKDGVERSTMDIDRRANVCAVGTLISELRRNGAVIECRQEVTPTGRVFLYRMTRPAPKEAQSDA